MSRTYKHQHKYKLKEYSIKYHNLINRDYKNTTIYHDDIYDYFVVNKISKYKYIKPYYATNSYANYLISKIESLRNVWGEYISKNKRNYRTKLRRSERAKLKQQLIKDIDKSFEDCEFMFYDELFNNPSYDMFGGVIDKDCDEALDEDQEWLKYLGKIWTLEDELDYCDKVFVDYDEDTDILINKAMEALQDVRDFQQAFMDLGSEGRVELYFGDISTFLEDFNNAV